MGEAFDVSVKKSSFPHEFVSLNNLNYIGPHPITGKANWNLKKDLYNYLYSDVVSLWQIINKFRASMFIDYGLNILKRPTLPSIAFSNFRTNYLTSKSIVS